MAKAWRLIYSNASEHIGRSPIVSEQSEHSGCVRNQDAEKGVPETPKILYRLGVLVVPWHEEAGGNSARI